MKVYDVKIASNKLQEVADMMGGGKEKAPSPHSSPQLTTSLHLPDCTAKALTHRLSKLRSSFTETDTPATKKTTKSTPRKPASSAKKPKATLKTTTTPKNKKRKLSSLSASDEDDDDEDAADAEMPKNLNGQFDGGEDDDDDDDAEVGGLATPTPVRRVRRTPGRSAAKVATYAESGDEGLDDEGEEVGIAADLDVVEEVKTEPGFEVEGGDEVEGFGVEGVKTEHPAEDQYSSHASPGEQLRGDDDFA